MRFRSREDPQTTLERQSLSACHCMKSVGRIRSRPTGLGTRLGVERFNHRTQPGPRHPLPLSARNTSRRMSWRYVSSPLSSYPELCLEIDESYIVVFACLVVVITKLKESGYIELSRRRSGGFA